MHPSQYVTLTSSHLCLTSLHFLPELGPLAVASGPFLFHASAEAPEGALRVACSELTFVPSDGR
jgi:hypothetical protein